MAPWMAMFRITNTWWTPWLSTSMCSMTISKSTWRISRACLTSSAWHLPREGLIFAITVSLQHTWRGKNPPKKMWRHSGKPKSLFKTDYCWKQRLYKGIKEIVYDRMPSSLRTRVGQTFPLAARIIEWSTPPSWDTRSAPPIALQTGRFGMSTA